MIQYLLVLAGVIKLRGKTNSTVEFVEAILEDVGWRVVL